MQLHNSRTSLLSAEYSSNHSLETARMRTGFLSVLVFLFASTLVQAQKYTKIVVFGDSLSDTGNVAYLTEVKYGFRIPGPLGNYTDGRFTDGYDTVPAAQKYFGVWIEQLAESMPEKPAVMDSLDGGTNYAYGLATTGNGYSTLAFGPSNEYSVQVENIGQQITDYLAKNPKIDRKTLFVIWGGANDVLEAGSVLAVTEAAANQLVNVQRLIAAGATHLLVPNLPPLGMVPEVNGSPTEAQLANEASDIFNLTLGGGLRTLSRIYRRVSIEQLDVHTLFNRVAGRPSAYGLTNIKNSAQGLTTVDPDTYLFWDYIHPTTRGHNILAKSAHELVEGAMCDSRECVGVSF